MVSLHGVGVNLLSINEETLLAAVHLPRIPSMCAVVLEHVSTGSIPLSASYLTGDRHGSFISGAQEFAKRLCSQKFLHASTQHGLPSVYREST